MGFRWAFEEKTLEPALKKEIPSEKPKLELVPLNRGSFEAAPLLKRCLAAFVDYSVIGLGVYLFFFFSGLFFAAASLPLRQVFGAQSGSIVSAAFIMFSGFMAWVFLHGYFIYFEFTQGRTPGKKIFGLRVSARGEGLPSFRQCLIREASRYLDGLGFLGLYLASRSKSHQRLGDQWAHTWVTHSAGEENQDEFFYLIEDDYQTLKRMLHPRLPEEAFTQEFLKFSHTRWILKTTPERLDEVYQWKEKIFPFVNASQAERLEEESLVRFFAEFCRRSFGQWEREAA